MVMKRFKVTVLVGCVLILVLSVGSSWASKKVVVIAGVSEDSAKAIGSYDLINDGIINVFNGKDITAEFQYVELTTLANDKLKEAAGAEAIVKARAANPNLIIVLDDATVEYVGTKIDDLPIVFAWIFNQPQKLGLPKNNITGVIRRSYAADIWALVKKFTGAKTVSLLSKDNPSMAGVRQYILAGADKLEAACGVRVKDMYLLNTFEQWESAVTTFPEDFIYLADTSRIEKDGKQLERAETTRWTVDHAKVPVVAAAEVDVKAGALFSIVTSEREIGRHAAELAVKVLSGTAPDQIPYVTSTKGKLVINAKTIQKQKIDIPYDTLSLAEVIYDK